MIITPGLGLQAFGIVLEIVGLFYAYRSLGTVMEQWSSFIKRGYTALLPDVREEFEEDKRKLTDQIKIIGIGLALQLLGLFVP